MMPPCKSSLLDIALSSCLFQLGLTKRQGAPGKAHKQLNRVRLICETVNAQLQEQLHLSYRSEQVSKIP